MQKKRKFYFLLLLLFSFGLQSQTKVKTMFYNVLNYDGGLESNNRTIHLKNILDNVAPDLFLVCELKDEIGSNYLFNNAVLPHNNNFKKAPFLISENNPTLLQMAYYNSEKLILENTEAIQTSLRDINHYTFKLKTENLDSNPIYLEVFVTHLKASRGVSNRLRRLSSVEDFINQLSRIPSDRHILFAGDFNFYTSNEEGFQKLIDNVHPINIVDPINRPCPTFPNDNRDYFDEDYDSTYFWNNSSFADVHSQSTRSTGLTDGAGGGMDDRFDFIMMSENFNTSSNLYYKQGSYKAIGNNGNCYNSSVNDTDCTGDYSLALREALYQFSDHLPIVMEMESPENTLSIDNDYQPFSFLGTNISRDVLFLNLKEKINHLKIYNQLGQIVFQQQEIGPKKIRIDINKYSKGVYYIKIDTFKILKFLKI